MNCTFMEKLNPLIDQKILKFWMIILTHFLFASAGGSERTMLSFCVYVCALLFFVESM